MKIVSLLENTTEYHGMDTEHGLSLYIETGERKILFDMGQTDMFAKNAAALGIDLSAVDTAVLSHGHYDHGGGMAAFFRLNDHAPVYMNRRAFLPYYNGNEKYIGLDSSLETSPRIIFVGDKSQLSDNLILFSCNDKIRMHSLGNSGLTEKIGDSLEPDRFLHEQYLCIKENGRKILISGCSHKGILDIVEWFDPDVLVGGFHFSKMPLDDRLAEAAKTLDLYKTEYYTCHCTGAEQYLFMKKYMKNLNYLSCGQILYI